MLAHLLIITIVSCHSCIIVLSYSFIPRSLVGTRYNTISSFYLNKEATFIASRNTKLNLINENEISPTDAASSRTFSTSKFGSFLEEDINFCLRKSDTALSGISRSKVLNELSNSVMRALIIGHEPIIKDLFTMFEEYREQVDDANCVFDEDDVLNSEGTGGYNGSSNNNNINRDNCEDAPLIFVKSRKVTVSTATMTSAEQQKQIETNVCAVDLLTSRVYVDRLEKLLRTGFVQESVLGGIYDKGYKRLLTILRDAGCVFSPPASVEQLQNDPLYRTYRPKPTNQDICLSILDKAASNDPNRQSKTMILNTMSNVVFRTVLYGRKVEKTIVIQDIENLIPAFAKKWTNGDENAQEIIFLKTLQLLLSQGLQSAESVIASKAGSNLNALITSSNSGGTNSGGGSSSIYNTNVDYIGGSNNYPSNVNIFNNNNNNNNAADNTINRVNNGGGVNFGGLYSNTAKNGEIDNIFSINEIVSNRLYDTYQNAFYRVVESCFTEIGKRADSVPQNNDVLLNIANWERNIRAEVTDGLWIRNPTELVGTWWLTDVAGEGALSKITFGSTNEDENRYLSSLSSRNDNKIMIELTKEGKVIVQSDDFIGNSWVSTPGPAHLDTCEFTLTSRSDTDLILKYVGFIDRGQRIESRFSRNPIRMTGRVISIEKAVMRGSNRFIMTLPRKPINAGTVISNPLSSS